MARENGYATEKRSIILDYLKSHCDETVTVKDIETFLNKGQEKSINVTTIYRYLDKLEKEGQVIKHTDENGKKAAFQYVKPNASCHSHLHMKCTGCGKIWHLDCGFMNDLKNHILVHHNFMIECSSSMIYGLCENCR